MYLFFTKNVNNILPICGQQSAGSSKKRQDSLNYDLTAFSDFLAYILRRVYGIKPYLITIVAQVTHDPINKRKGGRPAADAGRENDMGETLNKKKGFEMPHVFVILLLIMVLVTALSYIIPSGAFDRVDGNAVDPDSFHFVENENPISFQDFWSALYDGFVNGSTIMGSLLLSAGSLGILNSTGVLEKGVKKLTKITNGKNLIAIIIFYLYFAGMNILGAGEGVYPFFPIVTAIIMSLGYDRLMAGATIMFAATAGFACGMVNMFTTGISQEMVGLPIFSGIGYRFIVFLVLGTIGLVSVLMYGRKIRKDPNKSYEAEEYKKNLAELAAKEKSEGSEEVSFTWREGLTLIIFLALVIFIAYGCLELGFTLAQFAAYYVVFAIIVAVIYRINPNKFCAIFVQGASQVLTAAFAIGMAQSVMVLLTQGQIMDTLVYYMGNALDGKSPLITLLLIFLFVTGFNFLVVSGSGKALMMMPIMSPLGKMLGINQQVMVLTYQLGDGITNMFWPGGGLISCSLCGLNYGTWIKMAWKTFVTMIVSGYVLICIANAIGYGPF